MNISSLHSLHSTQQRFGLLLHIFLPTAVRD
uniref:Uncharacterized protein n=1 Tax=Rhizophora mucronata TaxID=61149 RepID=A0A2P2QBW8_RHIMU